MALKVCWDMGSPALCYRNAQPRTGFRYFPAKGHGAPACQLQPAANRSKQLLVPVGIDGGNGAQLVQLLDNLRRQRPGPGLEVVRQLMELGGANQHAVYPRLGQQPGNGDLTQTHIQTWG